MGSSIKSWQCDLDWVSQINVGGLEPVHLNGFSLFSGVCLESRSVECTCTFSSVCSVCITAHLHATLTFVHSTLLRSHIQLHVSSSNATPPITERCVVGPIHRCRCRLGETLGVVCKILAMQLGLGAPDQCGWA